VNRPEQATGRVTAVCLSSTGGVPKVPAPEVQVGPYGVEGDWHAGAERPSRQGAVPNRRQVSVVAREALEGVAHDLGVSIPWGGFGENVLVEGLGTLGELQGGERLVFDSGVVLEVTEQNQPCRNLSVWHKLVPKSAYGRRGILAVVRATGTLRPGEGVWVEQGID
jgi:MOSC domain-containing protein YiiM